jgi:NTP pyrophosphatase (non-canonical NTP hydrolase)
MGKCDICVNNVCTGKEAGGENMTSCELGGLGIKFDTLPVSDNAFTGGLYLKGFAEAVHALAVKKGWYDDSKNLKFSDFIGNIHAEVSEAFELYRKYKTVNRVFVTCKSGFFANCFYSDYPGFKKACLLDFDCLDCPQFLPEGIPVELADVLLRVFDMCEFYNIDLEFALKVKHRHNETRPYRHGGKAV